MQICLWKKTQFDLKHYLKRGKQISKRLVRYIINIKSLFHRGLCLLWANVGQNPPSASKSDYYNP